MTIRLGATSTAVRTRCSAVGQDLRLPRLAARVRRRRRRRRRGREPKRGCPRSSKATRSSCTELAAVGHETKPPARYTEASLVKELEERGIGRPSTYAAVIETIQARSYVWRKGTTLVPAWTAFAITNLLEQHFAHLVDYSFTATMEEALDVIAPRRRRSARSGSTPSTSATGHPVCANSSPTTRSASSTHAA